MNDRQPGSKGVRAEEQLRAYFLGLGYYVARGVKIRGGDFDITDVDLWLYHKHSPLGRERINVDIKNKRTPQAIERIFWARGVQVTLGFDKCIVATTDRRRAVVDFGRLHGVTVIDGHFLSKLPPTGDEDGILSEEEFQRTFGANGRAKGTKVYLDSLESAKSRLVSALDFDGCNSWIEDIRYFIDQWTVGALDDESAFRAIYVLTSYLLLGLDFSLSPVAFLPQYAKRETLEEGLRHGAEGRARTESVLHVASMLIEQYVPDGRFVADRMRRDLLRLSEDAPVGILAEYFAGTRLSSELFRLSKLFSTHGYARILALPKDLTSELKSILGVLSDYFGYSRAQIFGAIAEIPIRADVTEMVAPSLPEDDDTKIPRDEQMHLAEQETRIVTSPLDDRVEGAEAEG